MICVFDVTDGPARGRRFWIRANEKLEIGRISTADFSVPTDKHMSRHHLILEGREDGFRIRDAGSVNHTFVNGAKVSSIELCNGDIVKAGETQFAVSIIQGTDSPTPALSLQTSSIEAVGTSTDSVDSVRDSAKHDSRLASENDSSVARKIRMDDDSTNRVNGSSKDSSRNSSTPWWRKMRFEHSGATGFYCQAKGAQSEHSISVVLKKLERDFAMTAIVSQDRIRAFDKELIEDLKKDGVVSQCSSGVLTIMNSCSREFYMLAESLVGQDAMILVGSSGGLDPKFVANLCEECPTPSEAGTQLQNKKDSRRKQVWAEADVMLYETAGTKQLNLLLRKDLD